jgi:small subunit ribosomal protein S4
MSRYRGPRIRIVRRLGELRGLTKKVTTRTRPPGQHDTKPGASSEYAIRLKEKQKIKYNYGISERQLSNYVKQAKRMKGSTGLLILQLSEMRLDNIVFRLGFATTIPESRQLINHGHFLVNNKSVDIPSFQCTPGDSITIEDKDQINVWRERINNSSNLSVPTFLELDKEKLIGSVKSIVGRNEVGLNVNELLIVEYYSRK